MLPEVLSLIAGVHAQEVVSPRLEAEVLGHAGHPLGEALGHGVEGLAEVLLLAVEEGLDEGIVPEGSAGPDDAEALVLVGDGGPKRATIFPMAVISLRLAISEDYLETTGVPRGLQWRCTSHVRCSTKTWPCWSSSRCGERSICCCVRR